MTKRPLGRGLSALLSAESQPQDNDQVLEVAIDLIRPGHAQPRTSFQENKLQELAQSIRTTGVIQPILVRPLGGAFELIAGERRWRAAQIAGLSRIPAIVRDIPEDRLLEFALVENIQRQELNPIEEANAYKRLIESLGLTQEEVAQRVGRDRTFITNYLRVLKLPSEIQALLESERLSFGHARALLGIPDAVQQRRLARKIVTHGWSVREIERRIKHASTRGKITKTSPPRSIDPNIRSAEAKLRRYIGTQVRIVSASSSSPGRIEIEYYSMADLDRIYTMILKGHEQDSSATAVGA